MPGTLGYKHGVTNTAATEYNSVRCSSEQSPNLQIRHTHRHPMYSPHRASARVWRKLLIFFKTSWIQNANRILRGILFLEKKSITFSHVRKHFSEKRPPYKVEKKIGSDLGFHMSKEAD